MDHEKMEKAKDIHKFYIILSLILKLEGKGLKMFFENFSFWKKVFDQYI